MSLYIDHLYEPKMSYEFINYVTFCRLTLTPTTCFKGAYLVSCGPFGAAGAAGGTGGTSAGGLTRIPARLARMGSAVGGNGWMKGWISGRCARTFGCSTSAGEPYVEGVNLTTSGSNLHAILKYLRPPLRLGSGRLPRSDCALPG